MDLWNNSNGDARSPVWLRTEDFRQRHPGMATGQEASRQQGARCSGSSTPALRFPSALLLPLPTALRQARPCSRRLAPARPGAW